MKRNVYTERQMARKLPVELQKNVMHAARAHGIKKGKNGSWAIPATDSLLFNKTAQQQIAMNRIWYDVVALGSRQGN